MSPRRARAVDGTAGQSPGAALQAHLLDATERLLAVRPVAAITAREIAREADVSSGVLYNYFGDKNALVVAALSRRLGVLVDAFEASVPQAGTGTGEENLVRLVAAVRTAVDAGHTTAAGLLGSPDLMHRLFEETHAEAQPAARFMTLLTGWFAAEQGLGRLRTDAEPHAMAGLLVGGCLTMVLAERMHGAAAAQVEEDIRHLAALLLHGTAP
jgi:AcrR family transcriptional regulator